MNLIEKATVIHFHRHRIAQYQAGSSMALGWKNQHSQDARFAALMPIGNMQGCTVLDIGCGYGDFKAYLDHHATDYSYTGIDMMPEFIDAAQARYADHGNAAFYQCDFTQQTLPEVDYVFASGALSYRSENPDFFLAMIDKLHRAARCGLAFNMLDAAYFPSHPLLVGHDRATVLDFCQNLSAQVELVSGYLSDDFTILLRKTAHSTL